ncbi:dTDP-4-dehydrorhamnose reductase [Mailhella massiliensis]|uniref:dTDP-4-dehydrorhamnose reductase n=1 Tax=Mailhella massiliensis TaxID=1903261 RepID=A0A921DQU9_9BACT|nr:dTDP-4-dehydrorhamnose reductase [Mailhella massiliensis]HJD96935.1 dTDP-4-dehydrorhamnose reductase [Mailhella massiliensis]
MLLVTGANGQLGRELRLILKDGAVYVGHEDLDIANEAAVKAFFAARDFDFVINCAAYTAVDRAEDDAETAEKTNALGPRHLALYGRRIIQISTDYVFSGESCRPYREEDCPAPLSVYGRTKLAGEEAVLREAETAAVVRTSWLYSPFGANFVKTMRRLGAEKESVGVVFDQAGTPTYAADLASAITAMLPKIRPGMKDVYHFSNEGVTSWYDFACAVMEESNLACRVRPIESTEYPTRAVRPAYSVLNKTKIKQEFGISIPHWRDGLRRCMKSMERGG